ALITATIVSMAGSIGFVGLVVPPVMRFFFGPLHRTLLIASALAGAILMVLAYEVRLRGYSSPTFALAAMDNNEQQTEQHRYYRAEVYLKEGGQNYDVMGWNQ
ncbi:iron chelate uptake ABC transporter family permease subunit, partial [Acinetobacter baumannii]|uniref:iron chelate uptake ABC transporter family permease subunit n=1 Tax=Acinetobacter baumannii TaxID=470 RepID=UPI001D0EFE92